MRHTSGSQLRPSHYVAGFALLLSAAAVAAALYFSAEVSRIKAERDRLRAVVSQVEAQATYEKAEITQMRQTIRAHVRARQVERSAYDEVERHLTKLQTQKLALEEEVAFFRGIVASSKGQGLKIRRLFLFPGDTKGAYRFQVVLTRNIKDDKVLSGSLSLSIAGERDGEAHRIPATTLLQRSSGELDFRLRYFHRLEGSFALPPQFVPHRVLVRVKAAGEAPANVETAFDWTVITG